MQLKLRRGEFATRDDSRAGMSWSRITTRPNPAYRDKVTDPWQGWLHAGLVALRVCLMLAFGCHASSARAQPAKTRQVVDPTKQPSASAHGFGLRQIEGRWWLVSPAGQPEFSLGVCCVDQGVSRKDYDPENPSYAAWQEYSNATAWANTTVDRLQSWGFTTVGAWSDLATLRRSPALKLNLTPVLHLGSTAGVPWYDMWDSKIIQRMDALARDQILPLRGDPRLIGYYTDNELGWWNAALFKMTLEHSPSSGQRQRLIQLLRRNYQDDWSKLLADFEPEYAHSWATLNRRGVLYLRPGGNGIKTMRQFLAMTAERYYELMRQLIRKYDSQALILGDRYQSFFYPEVARAAGRYLDAVSSNLNAQWNDGSFLRSYLDTLHALTGKPIFVSELYLAARENRSGNQNTHGVFPTVQTQAERADGLRRTLVDLLHLPCVVGADWFQYYDEPTHGRDDGENYNFGLVDIHDHPYEDLVRVPLNLDLNRVRIMKLKPRLDASQGVPPAPPMPEADFEPMLALKHWDRERGYVKPSSAYPLADLYVCWSSQALYLGLFSLDIIEDAYYRDRNVPKIDRPVWSVQVKGKAEIRARLGTGREPLINDSTVRILNLSNVNLNVRNIALAKLDLKYLGLAELKPGTRIELSSSLVTHARADRVDWQGVFELAE
jgi:hypothetical protein